MTDLTETITTIHEKDLARLHRMLAEQKEIIDEMRARGPMNDEAHAVMRAVEALLIPIKKYMKPTDSMFWGEMGEALEALTRTYEAYEQTKWKQP